MTSDALSLDPLLAPLIRFCGPKPLEELRRPKILRSLVPSIAVATVAPLGASAHKACVSSASVAVSSTQKVLLPKLLPNIVNASYGGEAGSRVTPSARDIVAAILPAREVQIPVDKNLSSLVTSGGVGINASTANVAGSLEQSTQRQQGVSVLYQPVSLLPASRFDVIDLQTVLDNRLLQRQVKPTGLCPIRSSIYSDCFDELIRQITIDCPERGLLLLRIRDELRATLELYRLLYEYGVAFGVKRMLMASAGIPELKQKIAQIKEDKKQLTSDIAKMQRTLKEKEKVFDDKRKNEDVRRNEELTYWKRTIQHLSAMIKVETELAAVEKKAIGEQQNKKD